MISRSSPPTLTSVPDHLPNRTRSPTLTSMRVIVPCSAGAGADGHDLALGGLFLGAVGMMMSAGGLSSASTRRTEHAVVQRTEGHGYSPLFHETEVALGTLAS